MIQINLHIVYVTNTRFNTIIYLLYNYSWNYSEMHYFIYSLQIKKKIVSSYHWDTYYVLPKLQHHLYECLFYNTVHSL